MAALKCNGFFDYSIPHDILSPEEQELQDTMDKLTAEISSLTGIPKWRAESAVKTAIMAYDAFIQKDLKEE